MLNPNYYETQIAILHEEIEKLEKLIEKIKHHDECECDRCVRCGECCSPDHCECGPNA